MPPLRNARRRPTLLPVLLALTVLVAGPLLDPASAAADEPSQPTITATFDWNSIHPLSGLHVPSLVISGHGFLPVTTVERDQEIIVRAVDRSLPAGHDEWHEFMGGGWAPGGSECTGSGVARSCRFYADGDLGPLRLFLWPHGRGDVICGHWLEVSISRSQTWYAWPEPQTLLQIPCVVDLGPPPAPLHRS